MNATGHRFIIVLFSFFNINCTLMVLQGNDVLSFYKELKYIVVKSEHLSFYKGSTIGHIMQ